MNLVICALDEPHEKLDIDSLSDVQADAILFKVSCHFRHIDELMLSYRASNALLRNRIRLRCQLRALDLMDILRLPYVGQVSINEIIQAAYAIWGDKLPNFREAYRLYPRFRELR